MCLVGKHSDQGNHGKRRHRLVNMKNKAHDYMISGANKLLEHDVKYNRLEFVNIVPVI